MQATAPILSYTPYSDTQLSFWCQQNLENNLKGRHEDVQRISSILTHLTVLTHLSMVTTRLSMIFLSSSLDSSQSNLWSSLWFTTLGITWLSLSKPAVVSELVVRNQKETATPNKFKFGSIWQFWSTQNKINNSFWFWNLPTEFGLAFGMTPLASVLPTVEGKGFFFRVNTWWSFEDDWELNSFEVSNDLLRSCFGSPVETFALPLGCPLTVDQEKGELRIRKTKTFLMSVDNLIPVGYPNFRILHRPFSGFANISESLDESLG